MCKPSKISKIDKEIRKYMRLLAKVAKQEKYLERVESDKFASIHEHRARNHSTDRMADSSWTRRTRGKKRKHAQQAAPPCHAGLTHPVVGGAA